MLCQSTAGIEIQQWETDQVVFVKADNFLGWYGPPGAGVLDHGVLHVELGGERLCSMRLLFLQPLRSSNVSEETSYLALSSLVVRGILAL
jgi:hypothetical protein